ncbi:hypothetical protein BLA39750_01286 [Burkholderia lata]|uniref:DUF2591 domain-containing protein n=1 Tax=Burkholderia lata (strain ATCC 17760 / DSM 23089 / LMG 22485 / NCIMB 9086 / R18194 / 383) TaxID=482957 RepID=A0A6P2VPC3_BURL3|nr:phage protein NinX family protein [Burkholderia lata]VWC82199.1 hypothetical protein BLA39750_01286 [Burkholderia lata]
MKSNIKEVKLPEIVWEDARGRVVAFVNGVEIGHVARHDFRPRGASDALMVFLAYSDGAVGKKFAATDDVASEDAGKARLQEMAYAALANETPSDLLAAMKVAPPAVRLPSMTRGDGNAIMVLVAEHMGLNPALVAEATRHLEGGTVHPMSGAAIEKEAAAMNDRLRVDAKLIAQANAHSDDLKMQYGFAERKLPSTQGDTVRVSVQELSGVRLDWAVARCEGYSLTTDGISQLVEKDRKLIILGPVTCGQGIPCGYSPSNYWEQGGPITQRHRINVHYCRDLRDRNGLYIHASMDTHSFHGYWRGGHDKPLVAAMRCYVASKFRESIDVPTSLTA